MRKPYSQLSAAFAIAKASFLAMLRSPTSIVFSILFPVIFIIVFGSIVDTGAFNIKIAVSPTCDTANPIYTGIKSLPTITIQDAEPAEKQTEELNKARFTAILNIQKDTVTPSMPHYKVMLISAGSTSGKVPMLSSGSCQAGFTRRLTLFCPASLVFVADGGCVWFCFFAV